MSTHGILNAIAEYTDDSGTSYESDKIKLLEFALSEAIVELDRPKRALVLEQVKDEVAHRIKLREKIKAREAA